MTLIRGGTVSVLNDATLGKAIQIKSPTSSTDIMFDNVPVTSSSIDTNFKIKGGTAATTDKPGVLVFSNADATSGYFVRWDNNSDDKVRIFKRSPSGATYTNTEIAVTTSFPTTTGRLWRVTASSAGGVATITAYRWNGTAWVQFLQAIDSTSPYLAGGMAISQTQINSTLVMDNFIINFPDTDTIGVSTPDSYQVFQRNGSNLSDMRIFGRYTGNATAIEASFNGGAYQTIDSVLTNGFYDGILTAQAAGQGDLVVRFTNNTSVSTTVPLVGVGDVFIVAGQSNAVGRGQNPQSYSHPTLKASVFRADDAWRELTDPSDIFTDQGSAWPLVATYVMDSQEVPVAFLTTATGATGLVSPQDWKKNGTGQKRYEAALLRVLRSHINSAKAVLWYQGETDAGGGVSRSNYLAGQQALTNNFATDIAGAPKTIIASLSQINKPGTTELELDTIRLSQQDAWNSGGNNLYGPVLYDLGPHADGGHIYTDSDMQKLAARWWSAIEKHYYSGPDGRGPILSSAVYTTATNELVLTFIDDTLPLNTTVDKETFILKQGGVVMTIGSVSVTASNQVTITPSTNLSGPITISVGSGNSPSGKNAVRDTSANSLPAETVVDAAVTII